MIRKSVDGEKQIITQGPGGEMQIIRKGADGETQIINEPGRQIIIHRKEVVRGGGKKSVEENKTDKAEMAKNCREFKSQLEKYKAEEKENAEK